MGASDAVVFAAADVAAFAFNTRPVAALLARDAAVPSTLFSLKLPLLFTLFTVLLLPASDGALVEDVPVESVAPLPRFFEGLNTGEIGTVGAFLGRPLNTPVIFAFIPLGDRLIGDAGRDNGAVDVYAGAFTGDNGRDIGATGNRDGDGPRVVDADGWLIIADFGCNKLTVAWLL